MEYAVILAGGVGSRFWPLSRKDQPKQFLRLIGKDTFFEATLKRLIPIIERRKIFIVTSRAYLGRIKKQAKIFGVPESNIIAEPEPKNTLPAILLCARLIYLADKEANILVLPADHHIKGGRLFRQAVRNALKLSAGGFICLMGVRPDSPNTGYGYIKAGRKIGRDGFYVRCFIEKPSKKNAEVLLKQGNVFWNSGIFCFKALVILRQAQRLTPETWRQIQRIGQLKDAARVWPAISPASLDYGILEKSKNVVFIKAGFFWRDLGTWEALYNILPKDACNNVTQSGCVMLNSSNSLVYAPDKKRTIAIVGMKDTIVVDTPDAVLVCAKENAQDVKELVGLLSARKKACV